MKNISQKQQLQIDKYLQELQQQQAIEHQHEISRLYNEFEMEIMHKLIACVNAISVTDNQASNKLLKLSKAYSLLK